MEAKILWLEGSRATAPLMITKLRKKGYAIETVQTGKEALDRVNVVDPDLVIVDAVSLRTSGKRICQTLRREINDVPIILICNPGQSPNNSDKVNAVLEPPFTIRKLENRIINLLPGGSDRVMRVGPVRLDLERKIVYRGNQEAHLTPRLTRLLRMLMEHPGEVIDRKYLFRRVWRTDYTGDTRTLDVHISWLRAAIEDDPRHPEYLITIRGVGYRLDV
jgi:DNA-binding response OmpR family regulator